MENVHASIQSNVSLSDEKKQVISSEKSDKGLNMFYTIVLLL